MKQNELPVIGVFPLANTACICVHAIEGERVRFSLNGQNPAWTDIVEKPLSMITGNEDDNENWEPGFLWGTFFIPFSETMGLTGDT